MQQEYKKKTEKYTPCCKRKNKYFYKWSKFAFKVEKFSQQAKSINATTTETRNEKNKKRQRPTKSLENKNW